MDAPTITCTPGGASDNCYLSEAQATAYFADTLTQAEWESYGRPYRLRALIQATTMIEALGGPARQGYTSKPLFRGAAENDDDDSQRLHFPRFEDADGLVPEGVQAAVCEQALFLLQTTPSFDGSTGKQAPALDGRALADQGLGSFAGAGVSGTFRATGLPRGIGPKAWDLIAPFRRGTVPTR